MTDERTTPKSRLQSEIISDCNATSATPLGTEAGEFDRIARIKALAGQFHKNTTELVLTAHRLGRELKALRDESPYGQWEKRFDTDLTFISKRNANNFINLARAFKSEAELAGLSLTAAMDAARSRPRNAPSKAPRTPGDEGRSYVRKLMVFRGYLDHAEPSEIGPRLAVQDCDEAIEHWTAIVQAGNEAITQLKRLRGGPETCNRVGGQSHSREPSSGPGIVPGKQKTTLVLGSAAGGRNQTVESSHSAEILPGEQRAALVFQTALVHQKQHLCIKNSTCAVPAVPGEAGPTPKVTRFRFPPASVRRRGRLHSPCPRA